jgi:hypothetical protein
MLSDDIHLRQTALGIKHSSTTTDIALDLGAGDIALDFTPGTSDILSRASRRDAQRTSVSATGRFMRDKRLNLLTGAGVYKGFSDFRSLWLDEYYRQLFENVPGYIHASPRGWHALVGLRWAYIPATAYLQCTIVRQSDHVSPGYEPRIGEPLLSGREKLGTTSLRISTENILCTTVRSLVEIGLTETTGRDTRFSAQASVNWSATESLTLRAVVAGVREAPEFQAGSGAITLEYDWNERWFLGLTARAYRDNGELIDPLIVSTAAPALRSTHIAASLRWQGEHASLRLEAGPYRTRYDAVSAASAHFDQLYSDRDWTRFQASFAFSF